MTIPGNADIRNVTARGVERVRDPNDISKHKNILDINQTSVIGQNGKNVDYIIKISFTKSKQSDHKP